MTSKEIILRQLQSTSNEIALKFDENYNSDLDIMAQELATSYNILLEIVNKDKDHIPDNDFQSALLYWTALNSVLASLELLRRGYTKEPQMIMRNVLEIFAVAYNFHTNPCLYQQFITSDKKFDSAKSITEAKKVHSIIGQQYGMLSQFFTHVGLIHVLPHKVTNGLYVGGMFDPDNHAIVNINPMAITGTLDILNSLLELTFIQHITNSRFWKKIDDPTCEYTPNKERTEQIMKSMKQSIDSLDKEEDTG